ncbi:MAG TPA: Gfo/Idh/MocA family oxidoreductase [Bryobacteraceae bacterium]|nr:Gfo/Idh/MocA family oxidoreductase [Bryobacteraceae bacterium]HUI77550.1 Gfo/Idh/MocA family oxidoreductase [Bryobacteraceae bacterium]
MQSRRNFIGKVATGLAGTLAASNVLGAGERVRFGVIGAGARGTELLREALACPNTECAGFADVYAKRREEAQAIVPGATAYQDYRRLLDDRSLDAVLIATPPHLHAEQFIASLEAGKHVYQERTMAFTLEDAKRMRAAHQRAANRAVQVGHQSCSSGQADDATNFLQPELMGKITGIRAHFYRNTPHGKPQWARPVYPDMTRDHIAWDAFLGSAPKHDFDANRFQNWRLYWDYSGGSVTENLSPQLAFWYKLLGLQIPGAVTMTGGLYLWKDGREVPDTIHVSMEHHEEMLFGWDSGFGNNQLGIAEEVLGTNGSISRSQQIRYTPQKVNRPGANEMMGTARTEPRAHMQNFLDAVRGLEEPNCPFEVGFRVSIACRMAVESYFAQRTVLWDSVREEIV